MMFATSLALIAQAFRGRDRGTAFGVFGARHRRGRGGRPGRSAGSSPRRIGWEWIFFVNVPIGIAAVFVTLSKVEESRDPDAKGVDWAGLMTFSGGAVPARVRARAGQREGLGLDRDRLHAGRAPSCCWSLFLVVELAQQRPMLDLVAVPPPRLHGREHRRLRAGGVVLLDVPVPDALHPGRAALLPVQAGLRFLPITLLSFIVAPVAGRSSVRVPVRLLLGAGWCCAGSAC